MTDRTALRLRGCRYRRRERARPGRLVRRRPARDRRRPPLPERPRARLPGPSTGTRSACSATSPRDCARPAPMALSHRLPWTPGVSTSACWTSEDACWRTPSTTATPGRTGWSRPPARWCRAPTSTPPPASSSWPSTPSTSSWRWPGADDPQLRNASRLLMMADLFAHFLSGASVCRVHPRVHQPGARCPRSRLGAADARAAGHPHGPPAGDRRPRHGRRRPAGRPGELDRPRGHARRPARLARHGVRRRRHAARVAVNGLPELGNLVAHRPRGPGAGDLRGVARGQPDQ